MSTIARLMLVVFLALALWAQDGVYICPMHPEERSNNPGMCTRCGMKMVAGLPDPVEYPVDLTVTPRAPKPGAIANLKFTVRDPWKNRPVKHFQEIHEKLFHMFVVSQDLQFFVHGHPEFGAEGDFRTTVAFPQPGLYRVLSDFYPDGATPQLIAKTIIVPGQAPAPAVLARDYSTKNTENMQVALETDPPQPIAGMKTIMYFRVSPADGLEKYIGAWAHMLAASDDLVDMIHTHPFIADGGPQLQFNITFPRARTYRIWVQFQRKGVVNTSRFDVPVEELK